jgi:hypothetical protein
MISGPFLKQRSRRVPVLAFLLFLVSLNAAAQPQYNKTDRNEVQQQRKELKKAIENRDKSKLYSIGAFFEKIYDKYRDTSIRAAIRCYEMAASSESEYGNNWDSYAAALKLAKIYETGKGTAKDLQRSLIYYYLSDSSFTAPYNQLNAPLDNKEFDKLKAAHCSTIGPASIFLEKNAPADSILFTLSPFCNAGIIFTDSLIRQIGIYLRNNPELNVLPVLSGSSPVPAAQYSLKTQNFVLPRFYDYLKNQLMEREAISESRFLHLRNDFYTQPAGYRLLLKMTDQPDTLQ